ncbi:uncharacterized protein MONOS_15592 [Monocercomonoides exilis]|uniref:uncharacterized protein n=1 Tax=Monocercomonoides exilis TaxID=2049356 RepID=UPI003559E683|nr:hypothetical protein MONOS_15592 [Monocercomonoides exilis]|eukprot:MONOS_15592.1-p1 / transcript=MONOS_15592.1 / gene=MONOS_15592 / organism=Monocercomonoides_exilis_PA203 / gene_product=unspecified product / transcript_product=unspecified product / location=Mono_scaffold01281:7794-8390(-) / protein_length=157 / sequence_SO=supercontig / SO=protein_coding / is_pseudo=false
MNSITNAQILYTAKYTTSPPSKGPTAWDNAERFIPYAKELEAAMEEERILKEKLKHYYTRPKTLPVRMQTSSKKKSSNRPQQIVKKQKRKTKQALNISCSTQRQPDLKYSVSTPLPLSYPVFTSHSLSFTSKHKPVVVYSPTQPEYYFDGIARATN